VRLQVEMASGKVVRENENTELDKLLIQLLPEGGSVDDYLKWFNDPKVRSGLFPTTPTDAVNIESWLSSLVDNPKKFYQFIGVGDKIVGHIGLNDIDQRAASAEVGIVIGEKDFWGKGLGDRVFKMLMPIATNQLGLSTIYARIAGHNFRSINLVTKNGFRLDKTSGLSIPEKWKVYSCKFK